VVCLRWKSIRIAILQPCQGKPKFHCPILPDFCTQIPTFEASVLIYQNADSADIFVVLLGYVLMHGTFVHLFINMRKIGSNFWLRKSRDISLS
jgi:hypothetical protein